MWAQILLSPNISSSWFVLCDFMGSSPGFRFVTVTQLVVYVMSPHTLVIAKSSSLKLSHCAGELSPHLQRHTKQTGLTNKPHSLSSSWFGPPGPASSQLTNTLVSDMQPRCMSRLFHGSQTSHPGHGLHSHMCTHSGVSGIAGTWILVIDSPSLVVGRSK